MGRYFTPRCLGLHATLVVLLPTFAWLTDWQLHRALSGNTLSWAYTFEWPLFGGYAIYIWWQLIHDQPTHRRAGTGDGGGAGHLPGRPDGAVEPAREPGWALRAGRRDPTPLRVAQHSRVRDQTPEEAAALAEYNRYLAELGASDADRSSR